MDLPITNLYSLFYFRRFKRKIEINTREIVLNFILLAQRFDKLVIIIRRNNLNKNDKIRKILKNLKTLRIMTGEGCEATI